MYKSILIQESIHGVVQGGRSGSFFPSKNRIVSSL